MPRRSNRGTSDTVFLQNAVKTLVANIRFASVDNPVKTLVVTSSIPNEGKSTISIELARALAAEPSLYLFDDSFSALDLTTDAKLRAALVPETRDALMLIVAQRIATITTADLILVLDNGRIIAQGTHAELLESSETYQEIVRSQGVEEEVA